MSYSYGMQGAPAVGGGLGGLPKRSETTSDYFKNGFRLALPSTFLNNGRISKLIKLSGNNIGVSGGTSQEFAIFDVSSGLLRKKIAVYPSAGNINTSYITEGDYILIFSKGGWDSTTSFSLYDTANNAVLWTKENDTGNVAFYLYTYYIEANGDCWIAFGGSSGSPTYNRVLKINKAGSLVLDLMFTAGSTVTSYPTSIVPSPDKSSMYVLWGTPGSANSVCIIKIDATTGTQQAAVSLGSSYGNPSNLSFDSNSNVVFSAHSTANPYNPVIFKLSPSLSSGTTMQMSITGLCTLSNYSQPKIAVNTVDNSFLLMCSSSESDDWEHYLFGNLSTPSWNFVSASVGSPHTANAPIDVYSIDGKFLYGTEKGVIVLGRVDTFDDLHVYKTIGSFTGAGTATTTGTQLNSLGSITGSGGSTVTTVATLATPTVTEYAVRESVTTKGKTITYTNGMKFPVMAV